MPGRVAVTQGRRPHRLRRDRAQSDDLFPAEVVDVLGLEGIDYAQLRTLFHLVREQAGQSVQGRAWARYTLLDVAALEVLIALCGGREALGPGRRLRLANVRAACQALRSQGFSNPLLQVPMVKVGRDVYAHFEKALIDPTSGQIVIDGLSERIIEAFDGDGSKSLALIAELYEVSANLESEPGPMNLTNAVVHLAGKRKL